MAKGRKTGGRRKGSPNKVNSELAHAFAALGGEQGETYARTLHDLACGQHPDPHVRVKALALIVPYLPWRKTADRMEITGADGGPLEVHDHFSVADPR